MTSQCGIQCGGIFEVHNLFSGLACVPPDLLGLVFISPFKKKKQYDEGRGHTVHLALVGEDDLPAATRRVDGEGLLEALLNVWAPHALRIILQGFVERVPQLLTPTPGGGSRHPLRRRGGTTKKKGWRAGDGGSGLEERGVGKSGEAVGSGLALMKSTEMMMVVWMWEGSPGKARHEMRNYHTEDVFTKQDSSSRKCLQGFHRL